MPLIIDPDDLNQGGLTTPTDAVWGAPTGREVAITSAGTLLPDLAANVYFEVRDHPTAANNGLYRVNETNPTTGTITAFKVDGAAPLVDAVGRTVRIFATTAVPKSVHFDINARDIYLIEEGSLSSDGVTLQALYSFIKITWKADNDLIDHPFPMIAITPEQFEFIDDWNPFDAAVLGPYPTATEGFDFVDGGGGNDIIRDQNATEDDWVINGFRVGDDIVLRNSETGNDGVYPILAISGVSNEDAEIATASLIADTDDNTATVRGAIRSRKLIRTGGWSEVAETGAVLLRQYSGVITLGTFEDAANDTAYFQQGNDPTDIAAAIDFDFAGPVNESALVYNELGQTGTTYDFNDSSPDTIDNNGGDFLVDGYVVGGQVTVRAANTAANNGTYEITVLTAGTMTVQAIGGGDAGLVADLLDAVAQLSIDNRNLFNPRIRIRDADTNGKTFDASSLAAIGVTGAAGMDNKVFRFPLANATDLKIATTDADIDSMTPFTDMAVKYFDQAFNREVDSATNRDFGVVVDVGTHSGVDGSFTTGLSVLTTVEGGITGADFTGGTMRIHEGSDENTIFTISGTPTATTVTITGTFTSTETNISFTLQRATPISATAEQIYEFIQRQLRKNSDIDDTDQVVTGRTADALLRFVGDSLETGQAIPVNPNGGGSGVIIEGFDSNDTNRIAFFDNTGVSRTFPFVAAGTINFNPNLVNDTGPAEFFMFFEYTERFTNTGFGLSAASGDTATLDSSVTDLVAELANGDYIRLGGFVNPTDNGIFVLTGAPAGAGPWTAAVRKIDGETLVNETAGPTVDMDKKPVDSPDALIVNDNAGSPIEGNIGAATANFDFDYDNNVQGGRTGGVDGAIRLRALGLDIAAFVETSGTITRAVGLSFSLVAPLERNFSNP